MEMGLTEDHTISDRTSIGGAGEECGTLRYHIVESAQEAVQEARRRWKILSLTTRRLRVGNQILALDVVTESKARILSIRVRCGPLHRMFQMYRLDKI